jgi:hypothetical protein
MMVHLRWSAIFATVPTLCFCASALALDETGVYVAAYEHVIMDRLRYDQWEGPATFCLVLGWATKVSIIEPSTKNGTQTKPDVRRVGNGAPSKVISELKTKGYDVMSSNECVYVVSDGGRYVRARPQSSEAWTILIGAASIRRRDEVIFVDVDYWSGFGSCEGHTLTLENDRGLYVVADSKRSYIC